MVDSTFSNKIHPAIILSSDFSRRAIRVVEQVIFMLANDIPVPESWSRIVRKAVLHAASLAHYAIIYTRSMAANSPIERVRLKGKLDRAENEISLLSEQLELLKRRFGKIPAKHRPHYSPFERMAILEHRAARCWNLHQTAEEFLIDKLDSERSAPVLAVLFLDCNHSGSLFEKSCGIRSLQKKS